ncbi:MAG: phosphatase [Actinomycetota bacterium]
MDIVEEHARGLPSIDDRWNPRPYPRAELAAGLVDGRVVGPVSHPLDNVLGNIGLLNAGDPDKQFGMTGLPGAIEDRRILELVGELAGVMPDPDGRTGPVEVDAEAVLAACDAAAGRLGRAAERGEMVVFATGHPVGLIHLYAELARDLAGRGVKILQPADGSTWQEGDRAHRWQLRYLSGVAILTDEVTPKHTHSGEPMRRMLEDIRPDLVVADHGFAGAAIEAGIDAVSVADVNDPALIVARALGRTEHVIVMDDNVASDAYWPCYQSIAARLG